MSLEYALLAAATIAAGGEEELGRNSSSGNSVMENEMANLD